MYDRYNDIDKFITDPDKFRVVNGSEVYISSEDNYNIVVDLQGHTEEFEQLKPFIVLVAKNICRLDNIVQKFERQQNRNGSSSQFQYNIAVVFIDDPYIILEYWGTEENTQFDVVFEYDKEKFLLKSFGTIQDIPENWKEIIPTNTSKTKIGPQKGFWRKLMEWL